MKSKFLMWALLGITGTLLGVYTYLSWTSGGDIHAMRLPIALDMAAILLAVVWFSQTNEMHELTAKLLNKMAIFEDKSEDQGKTIKGLEAEILILETFLELVILQMTEGTHLIIADHTPIFVKIDNSGTWLSSDDGQTYSRSSFTGSFIQRATVTRVNADGSRTVLLVNGQKPQIPQLGGPDDSSEDVT